jgi:hypothetical protein
VARSGRENAAACWGGGGQRGRHPGAHRKRSSSSQLQERSGSGEVQTRWPEFIEEMSQGKESRN